MEHASLALGWLAHQAHARGARGHAASTRAFLEARLNEALAQGDETQAVLHMHALVNAAQHTQWRWLVRCLGAEGMPALVQEARHAFAALTESTRSRVLQDASAMLQSTAAAHSSLQTAVKTDPSLPHPFWNYTYQDVRGNDYVSTLASLSLVADAFVNTSTLAFAAYSRNNADLGARVFGSYFSAAAAWLAFDVKSYSNSAGLMVAGKTIFMKLLPVFACYLECRGPVLRYSSGQGQLFAFSRIFPVGGVPVELAVSVNGGFWVDVVAQLCPMAMPQPQINMRLQVGAFVGASGSVGVNALVARGGVTANLNIFNGGFTWAANLVAVDVLKFDLNFCSNAYIAASAMVASVDAYVQLFACWEYGPFGIPYLSWCPSASVNLFKTTGLSYNTTISWLTGCSPIFGSGELVQVRTSLLPYAPDGATTSVASLDYIQQWGAEIGATSVVHRRPSCAAAYQWTAMYATGIKNPVYVVYAQFAVDPTGERANTRWQVDPQVPVADQAAVGAFARTGYQCGHMAPARAFYSPLEDQAETFLMTNVVPQFGSINGGPWSQLEGKVGLMCSGTAQWVITGPSFNVNPDHPAPGPFNGVTVPTFVWKIVCRQQRDGTFIAWGTIVPNFACTAANACWAAVQAAASTTVPVGNVFNVYTSLSGWNMVFWPPGIPMSGPGNPNGCDTATFPTFSPLNC